MYKIELVIEEVLFNETRKTVRGPTRTGLRRAEKNFAVLIELNFLQYF
jgi:hypothetical protein